MVNPGPSGRSVGPAEPLQMTGGPETSGTKMVNPGPSSPIVGPAEPLRVTAWTCGLRTRW